MLSDKDFRNEVWKKYEFYSNNPNKEKFFESNLYKKNKNVYDIAKMIATFLIITTSSAGIVYAGIMSYNYIWKNPDIIDYQEEKQVTEQDKSGYITENQVKEKVAEILTKLVNEKDDISSIDFIKYPDKNISYCKVITNKKYEIKIDAETGKLVSYYDGTIDDSKITATANENTAKEVVMVLYSALSIDNDYELKSLQKISIANNSCLWQADFCKQYDGIYNNYQCIRITFIPEIKKIKMLNIFDEEFENNPIIITKDEAIETVKTKLQGEKINNVNCELKIEKMNPLVYMQDHPLSGNQVYRLERVVRKVWSVQCTIKRNNIEQQEKYYIDVTTGEIIGGDIIK